MKAEKTYWYQVKVDGTWQAAQPVKTGNPDDFTFMYVGDPQIGASAGQTPAEGSAKQTGEIATRNDAYNWNKTLNEALSQHPEINFLFFPMVLRGMGPVAAAVITSVIVLAATMYLINGWTKKSLAAFGATLGVILTACLAAILFGHAVNLSGYNVSNIENMMFVAQNTLIDVGQIFFAGILFASLGAVMDIAMDIAMDVTAACAELERHKPDISRKALFTAGMNVGRDVMGTMSTTLILAFFGGSLGVWLLDYAYDLPYLQLVNFNAVGIEIMKGFSASFGVIFTVPIAAALSAVTHKVEHK